MARYVRAGKWWIQYSTARNICDRIQYGPKMLHLFSNFTLLLTLSTQVVKTRSTVWTVVMPVIVLRRRRSSTMFEHCWQHLHASVKSPLKRRAVLHTQHHNGYVVSVQQLLIYRCGLWPHTGWMTTLVSTTSAWQSIWRCAATLLTSFDIFHF